jgi:serine/threonine protein kinase
MKPENIFLIQREGQPHFVKILDFGIAKVMGLDPNGPRLTRTGMIFGTPEYMAPEQAEGKDTDHRADIYAVGCIMYHLITGQTPFVAESFMTMLTKHLMEEPVPPSARRPDLVVIDGLVGTEGNGPLNGNAIKVDVVLAGRNVVAVDSVAAAVMGFDPKAIIHLSLAGAANLGPNDPATILVKGQRIDDVKRPFVHPQ